MGSSPFAASTPRVHAPQACASATSATTANANLLFQPAGHLRQLKRFQGCHPILNAILSVDVWLRTPGGMLLILGATCNRTGASRLGVDQEIRSCSCYCEDGVRRPQIHRYVGPKRPEPLACGLTNRRNSPTNRPPISAVLPGKLRFPPRNRGSRSHLRLPETKHPETSIRMPQKRWLMP